MFVYPIFRGCKYTNFFLFINKTDEFQRFELLITFELDTLHSNSAFSFTPPHLCHDSGAEFRGFQRTAVAKTVA